jgi:hypothetical protein
MNAFLAFSMEGIPPLYEPLEFFLCFMWCMCPMPRDLWMLLPPPVLLVLLEPTCIKDIFGPPLLMLRFRTPATPRIIAALPLVRYLTEETLEVMPGVLIAAFPSVFAFDPSFTKLKLL